MIILYNKTQQQQKQKQKKTKTNYYLRFKLQQQNYNLIIFKKFNERTEWTNWMNDLSL